MIFYRTYILSKFIFTLGYKGEFIKEYFLNFHAFNSDISIDLPSGNVTIHDGNHREWKVHLVDTGLYTQTGGRLKRAARWLDGEETFMFTYDDGAADVDIGALLRFHNSQGKLGTVTSVGSHRHSARSSSRTI